MIAMDNKVLACVDQSPCAEHVTDYAAWAARRLNAPLELLHVIDRHPEVGSGEDHSGSIGFNAQEALLTELADRDAARVRDEREKCRVFLHTLRERAIAAGVRNTDMRQRHGELEATLTEQEDGVSLFVLGRRGESAAITKRDLGRNVERVARAVHRPILTVTQNFSEPRRVMIAFDGGILSRKGVELVAESPLFRGLPCHLLMSGSPAKDGLQQMEWARKTLEDAGFEAPAAIVPGDAEQVIARAVQEQGVDLLIMGAYAHSPLRSLFLGSKTSDLLRWATVPTLLLR
jgi:nucleotide-binding universal stress UspA family protein